MVVEHRFGALMEESPHLDALILSRAGKPGFMHQYVEARRRLHDRRRSYDLAIDFQGLRRSAAWIYASGARRRVGIGGRRPGWQVVLPRDASRRVHAIDACAEVAEAAGIPVTDRRPEINVSSDGDAECLRRLTEAGLPESGFVAISPFSRWRSKDWPVERYAAVIEWLRRSHHRPVVLLGDAVDRTRALQPLIESGAATSFIGHDTLAIALALFKRAGLLIAGDSGPLHAAAALGTAVVGLYGPTLPECTAPRGPNALVVQALRPPHPRAYCEPDAGKYMDAIRVEMVVGAVDRALASVQ
jgi:ADP-heptose:LPS heptosyltransferase